MSVRSATEADCDGILACNGYRASGKVTDFFGMPLYEYIK